MLKDIIYQYEKKSNEKLLNVFKIFFNAYTMKSEGSIRYAK